LAAVGGVNATQQTQQGGLACAIAADQPDPPARRKLGGGAIDDRAAAQPDGDIAEAKHLVFSIRPYHRHKFGPDVGRAIVDLKKDPKVQAIALDLRGNGGGSMDGAIDGVPTAEYLWTKRGVVPFLKVDKGLEDEADGVQMMKPLPELDSLLARAREKGVFGTKKRSVINSASPTGIAAIVKQQFEVAEQILGHGLMPIIEPEVNIKSADRAQSDAILRDEILKALDNVSGDHKVMLKLSIPAEAGLFDPLVRHPRVLRVVALSGGFARPEACVELAKNQGIIASFSRALLEDLRHQMTDAEFDASLGGAIDEIAAASAT